MRGCVYQVLKRRHDDLLNVVHLERSTLTKATNAGPNLSLSEIFSRSSPRSRR
jgi:hypothetical protein